MAGNLVGVGAKQKQLPSLDLVSSEKKKFTFYIYPNDDISIRDDFLRWFCFLILLF